MTQEELNDYYNAQYAGYCQYQATPKDAVRLAQQQQQALLSLADRQRQMASMQNNWPGVFASTGFETKPIDPDYAAALRELDEEFPGLRVY
jgi:hypothetical protein